MIEYLKKRKRKKKRKDERKDERKKKRKKGKEEGWCLLVCVITTGVHPPTAQHNTTHAHTHTHTAPGSVRSIARPPLSSHANARHFESLILRALLLYVPVALVRCHPVREPPVDPSHLLSRVHRRRLPRTALHAKCAALGRRGEKRREEGRRRRRRR